MEQIYECSRCGALYQQQVSPDIWVCRQDSATTAIRMTLCQECQGQLDAWLKKKEEA